MKELIKMLKKSHEINVKMRWLKMINKEIDKYRKLCEKAKHQHFIMNVLIKEYEEEFGEKIRKGGAE